jgi:hypothetical protein
MGSIIYTLVNNHLGQRKELNLDQPAGDQQSMAQGGDRCLWAIGAVLGLLALAVALCLLFLQFLPPPPCYYASILSITREDFLSTASAIPLIFTIHQLINGWDTFVYI